MEQERRRRIIRIVVLSTLGVGALVFMAALDSVFGPLLFALLLAYILNPVVNWIQRAKLPRAPAIGVLFLSFYACLFGFVVLTVPAFVTQVGNLYQSTVGEKSFDRDEVAELKPNEWSERGIVRLHPPMPPGSPWFEDRNRNGRWDEGETVLSERQDAALSPEERRQRNVRPQAVAYLDADRDGRFDPDKDSLLRREEAEAYDQGGRVVWLEPPVKGGAQAYVDENGDGRYDPGYVLQVAALVGRLTEENSETFGKSLEQIRDHLVSSSTGMVEGALVTLSDAIYTLFGFLTAFILIPIYLFYFLLGLGRIRDRLFETLPGRHRDHIIEILTKIDDAVSAFFRGRLIIMVIKGAATGAILAVLGIPFALVLGVVTGVGSLIPIAGFLMGVVPAVCIALVDTGPGLAAGVAAIFVAIEIGENYFLGPWILKDRVGLHPITLILSVFVGGAVFGFVGMLLAVPMAAVAKILYLEFVQPEVEALASEEPGG